MIQFSNALYFFETCLEDEENRVIVDSKHWGNASRFINHHCEPNVKVVHVICEKFTVPIIALFAAKNIKANDELYIDYTDSYWRADSSHEKFCSCGSKHCRYSDPELSGFKATVRKRKKKAVADENSSGATYSELMDFSTVSTEPGREANVKQMETRLGTRFLS